MSKLEELNTEACLVGGMSIMYSYLFLFARHGRALTGESPEHA